MHTVELLEQALAAVEQLGYSVRQEWLGGSGGHCEFGGRKWLFIDLSLSTAEQLDQALSALRQDSAFLQLNLPRPLSAILQHRQRLAA